MNNLNDMSDILLKKGINDIGHTICLYKTSDKTGGYFQFKWYVTVDGEMLHQPSHLRRALHHFVRLFDVETST